MYPVTHIFLRQAVGEFRYVEFLVVSLRKSMKIIRLPVCSLVTIAFPNRSLKRWGNIKCPRIPILANEFSGLWHRKAVKDETPSENLKYPNRIDTRKDSIFAKKN